MSIAADSGRWTRTFLLVTAVADTVFAFAPTRTANRPSWFPSLPTQPPTKSHVERPSLLLRVANSGDDIGGEEDVDLSDDTEDGLVLQSFNLTELSLLPDLTPLKNTITANPPTDLESLPPPVPISLPNVPQSLCKIFNYDVGHAGRFTVFESGGATLDPDAVFEQDAPLSFIRQSLSWQKKEIFPCHPDEVVVFSPGLNTLHEPVPGQPRRTAPMRVDHYTRVLGLGMAQVHTGTQMDQGDAVINPVTPDLAELLRSRQLLPQENLARLEELGWTIDNRNRDSVQTVLSSQNLLETPLKTTIKRLLDVAVSNVMSDESEPHLVLLSYSRATVETSAALRSWKAEAKESEKYKDLSNDELEALLRKAVTVVTIGAAARGFPDGPAYVHVSMWEDQLTKSLGPMEGRRGGGADAVYIHATSPYLSNDETNDPHNMGACVAQLLCSAMKMCDTKSFRELYDNYHDRVAESDDAGAINDITYAIIQATKGAEWLWFPDISLVGMPPLPNNEEAKNVLDSAFGSGTYDDITKANSGGMQAIVKAFQIDALKNINEDDETETSSGAVANSEESSSSSWSGGGTKDTSKQEEPTPEDLAAKYAAIESLEERAFTILKDLGMI